MTWVLFYCGVVVLAALLLAGLSWRAQDHDDILDHGWAMIGYIAAAVILVSALIVPIVGVSDQITCRNKASNVGLPYRWSFSAGCYYQLPDGSWWPSDNIRNIDGQLRVSDEVQP